MAPFPSSIKSMQATSLMKVSILPHILGLTAVSLIHSTTLGEFDRFYPFRQVNSLILVFVAVTRCTVKSVRHATPSTALHGGTLSVSRTPQTRLVSWLKR